MRETHKGTTSKITQVTTQVVKLLTPLSHEDRERVINASLTLLGEGTGSRESAGHSSSSPLGGSGGGKSGSAGKSRPAKASTWVKNSGITDAELNDVFEITENGATFIGEVPGKNDKERTINAYVIEGITRLLGTGESHFDDKAARHLCQNGGFYNSPNHAVYMEAKGNLLTGSKDKGWNLTTPGLKRGAELVREIAKGS